MKKVVSFCLWGSNPHYLEGARNALSTAQIHYPDWEHWFYMAEDVPAATVEHLANHGARVIPMQRGGRSSADRARRLFEPAFWRFLPASDPEVDLLLVRDTDSPVTEREVAAVRQWLDSGMDLHIMRDHPKHEWPILAGMWGCRGSALRQMADLIARWKYFEFYGCDQKFLGKVIYPAYRDRALIHSECIRFPGEAIHPFPTLRNNDEFVGISFTGQTRVTREVGYLKDWVRAGAPEYRRPFPWSLIGRARRCGLIIMGKLGRFC
jgi:hypothetical protein